MVCAFFKEFEGVLNLLYMPVQVLHDGGDDDDDDLEGCLWDMHVCSTLTTHIIHFQFF